MKRISILILFLFVLIVSLYGIIQNEDINDYIDLEENQEIEEEQEIIDEDDNTDIEIEEYEEEEFIENDFQLC